MKKGIVRFWISLLILSIMTMPIAAVNYNEYGYYNATIYLQNDLTNYNTYFTNAVSAWNTAGVLERQIVVNTSSSSYIENCSFSEDDFYWQEHYSLAEGTYRPLTNYSYACSCHSTTSFVIGLNDDSIEDYNYTNQSDLSKAIQGLIVHELGHAFGLIDFYGSQYKLSSVMNTERNVLNIYTPQVNDINNANDCWAPHRD